MLNVLLSEMRVGVDFGRLLYVWNLHQKLDLFTDCIQ